MNDYYYPKCMRKTRHKTWFKVFHFLLIFILDCLDLISDWLLYIDVAATKEGLVFGPPEKVIVTSLLVFSIIGSITFVFEVINHGFDIFKGKSCIDTDLCSAIIIWIEDVPQIVLSVIIAACREGAISYFQLVKAAVVILGCIIRIIVASINYCNKRSLRKARQHNCKSILHTTYRVFIMLGLFIIFTGSIVVFVFTQSERNPDGSTKFRIPHKILEDEYDNEKYFNNVSIYFSHPLFVYNTTGSFDHDSANWIRLTTIFDVQNENANSLLKLQYDEVTKSKLVIWKSDYHGNLNVKDCYTLDRLLQKLKIESNCDSFLTTGTSEIIFTFHYVKPHIPGLVFGDITYNVKVKENGKCQDPNINIDSNVQKRLTAHTDAVMRYYRNKDSVSVANHVIHTTTEAKFYDSSDLIDIETVWKTGFAYCTSTGSLSPHHDTSLKVPC